MMAEIQKKNPGMSSTQNAHINSRGYHNDHYGGGDGDAMVQ